MKGERGSGDLLYLAPVQLKIVCFLNGNSQIGVA